MLRQLSVFLENKKGRLSEITQILADAGISVEYFYAFVSRSEDLAYVILRVEDCARAEAVLAAGGLRVVSREDIF